MRIPGSYVDAQVSGLGALGAGTPGGAVAVQSKKYGWVNTTSDPQVTGPRPPDALIFSDPESYVQTCVAQHDWQGVARWYATQLNSILEYSTNPRDFWGIATKKLTVSSREDFAAFVRYCILPYAVSDLGNKVGFGIADGIGGKFGQLIAFTELSSSNGALNFQQMADSVAQYGNGQVNLGWVKEPSDHLASRIIVAIGVGIMTAGAASAIFAPAAGAGGAAGGAATSGAASVASAAIPAGVETVVVTATPIAFTAGSVGAGIAAGSVVAAATPPAPISNTPTPVIETVITEASTLPAVAPATIGAGLATGAIVAVATAPPVIDTSNVIETVTTTSQRIEQVPVDPATAAGTGLVTVGIMHPEISVPEPTLPDIANEWLSRIGDNISSLGDAIGSLFGGPAAPPGSSQNDGGLPDWLNPVADVKNPSWLDYLKSPLVWIPLLAALAALTATQSRKKVRRRRHATTTRTR